MEATDEDGAVETNVDTDYVVGVTMVQGTWDPWPTLAQDPPMPAQDAPTSPHDDPTPTQEEWWQDSILFFLMLFRQFLIFSLFSLFT